MSQWLAPSAILTAMLGILGFMIGARLLSGETANTDLESSVISKNHRTQVFRLIDTLQPALVLIELWEAYPDSLTAA